MVFIEFGLIQRMRHIWLYCSQQDLVSQNSLLSRYGPSNRLERVATHVLHWNRNGNRSCKYGSKNIGAAVFQDRPHCLDILSESKAEENIPKIQPPYMPIIPVPQGFSNERKKRSDQYWDAYVDTFCGFSKETNGNAMLSNVHFFILLIRFFAR